MQVTDIYIYHTYMKKKPRRMDNSGRAATQIYLQSKVSTNRGEIKMKAKVLWKKKLGYGERSRHIIYKKIQLQGGREEEGQKKKNKKKNQMYTTCKDGIYKREREQC